MSDRSVPGPSQVPFDKRLENFKEKATTAIQTRVNFDNLEQKVKKIFFMLGSYLTEPVCKAHECYFTLSIVDAMHPDASKCANLARKFFLVLKMIGWTAVGVFTTVPGIILRGVGAALERNPFIYEKGTTAPRLIPENREITLLSWNVCCVGAGFPITDGGVTPREYRYDTIISKIVDANADIICLYEIFDVVTGDYFKKELEKKGYSQFYYNIGPCAVGVSSAMMVISRVPIADPSFTPFPKNTLVGRTKFAEKGVFAFSVMEDQKPVARILSTHPQHSERPAHAEDDEKKGRKAQMEIIQQIAERTNYPSVIVGDLNTDDDELKSYFEGYQRKKPKVTLASTWGGDKWCATLVGKKASGPLNLDHVLTKDETLVKRVDMPFITDYDDQIFSPRAISDHQPLKTTLLVPKDEE